MEKTVLAIDDDPTILLIIGEVLEDIGYKMISATNGAEGLELFNKYNPSIVITDLLMPVLDGIGFLKSLNPLVFNTHSIIVLSSVDDGNLMKEAYDLGVQSYLNKPINSLGLIGIVERSYKMQLANAEIRLLNDRFDSLLKNIPELVWECDENLSITYISQNSIKILGYNADEMIGTQLTDYLDGSESKELLMKFTTEQSNHHPTTFQFKEKTSIAEFNMKGRSGDKIPVQISANRSVMKSGKIGMVGLIRNLSNIKQADPEIKTASEELTIEVNRNLCLSNYSSGFENYLPENLVPESSDTLPDIAQFLSDQTLLPMFEFSFSQKEDLPFPVEFNFSPSEGVNHVFSSTLSYDKARDVLTGQLTPFNLDDKLIILSEHSKKQSKKLESAIVFDEETKQSILIDCRNLLLEIFKHLKEISSFAYLKEKKFDLADYKLFLNEKDAASYKENLRLISNKLHGLKGNAGFLIPEVKKMCHSLEEITNRLNSNDICYSSRVDRLMNDFFFHINDILEEDKPDREVAIEEEIWLEKIEICLEGEISSLAENLEEFKVYLKERSNDKGQLRKRKKSEFLTVNRDGYYQLAENVRDLFYSVNSTLSEDQLVRYISIYNDFLTTYHKIDKVALNLNRYQRFIPLLAEEYGKQVDFKFLGEEVLGDETFWGSIHEILNHCLKNSVIHGIEKTGVRKELGKQQYGSIKVELTEDELNRFILIKDDGQGINIDKIRDKAVENNFLTSEKLSQMSDEQLYQLIFLQGFSTTDELDENAGRGVGMNAVQDAMLEFSGECNITSESGKGTELMFSFPKNHVFLSCFIVKIGDLLIGIPEKNVTRLLRFDYDLKTSINRNTFYKIDNRIIPLLEPDKIFGKEIQLSEVSEKNIMHIKTEMETDLVFLFNEIIHHEMMPILSVPNVYQKQDIYLGATLFKKELVMVLDVQHLENVVNNDFLLS